MELFLWPPQGQVVLVSLGDLGDLCLQKGLEEKFLGSQGLLSPLLAQELPLDLVGPFLVNLKHLWILSDPSNHVSHSGRVTQRDLLFLEDLVSLDTLGDLSAQGPPFLLDVHSVQASPDHLDTLVVRRSQVVLAFQVVLWALEHQASPDLQALPNVLDIQGYLAHPLRQVDQIDWQDHLCFL